MIAVVRDSPVNGSNSANAASDGIVYSTPVRPITTTRIGR